LHQAIDAKHLREKRHATGYAVVRLPEDGQTGIRIEIDAQIERAGPAIARQWVHDKIVEFPVASTMASAWQHQRQWLHSFLRPRLSAHARSVRP